MSKTKASGVVHMRDCVIKIMTHGMIAQKSFSGGKRIDKFAQSPLFLHLTVM